MKRRNKHRDAYRDDSDREVQDGELVHVPALLMDSRQRQVAAWASDMNSMVGHRPGFAQLSDAQIAERARARDRWIAEMRDAWRTDARRRKPDPEDPDEEEDPDEDDLGREQDRRGTDARSIADARARATASYDRMVRRLSNAWRTPVRDAAQPDQGSRPDPGPASAIERRLESERGNTRVSIEEAAARLERDRQVIHQKFKNDLENAWKFRVGHM
jgi:hypothetical protein